MSLLRFRLVHLLILITVVSVVFWMMTEAGKEVAEVEVKRFESVSVLKLPGRSDWIEVMPPSVMGPSFRLPPALELVKLEFEFLAPEHLEGQRVSAFLSLPEEKYEIETGQQLKFKTRFHQVAWLKPEPAHQAVFQQLAIAPESIETVRQLGTNWKRTD